MKCFEGTFGATVCHVDVEGRPSVRREPVFVAVPFAFDEREHSLRWFANAKGHQVELFGNSEEDALTRTAAFLEPILGRQIRSFTEAPDGRSALVIKPPTTER